MDKLKFALFSVVVLFVLGLLGYWSIVTIQSGSEHAVTEKAAQLQKENDELKKQVADLTYKLGAYESQSAAAATSQGAVETPTPAPAPTPTPSQVTYKYQDLINELQKLVDDKVQMKLKSIGSRVGTVQKFLNIYNKTSNKVDNDYGASTKTAVAAFQKAQGLAASGEAGPATFQKMIDWLKKQG